MDFADLAAETAPLRCEYTPSALYARRRRGARLLQKQPDDEALREELELLDALAGGERSEVALVMVGFDIKRLRAKIAGENPRSIRYGVLLERWEELEILEALLRLELAREERQSAGAATYSVGV